MDKHPRRLVVIVTEAVLERTLVTDARRLGAQGYTVHDVRGGGAHGDHDGEWDADSAVVDDLHADTRFDEGHQ